jgi:hypothetical protein
LILRMLQFLRWAMLSVVTDGSFASSSSQLRPRAIAATNVARVTDRSRMLPRHPLGQKNLTTPRRWCLVPGDMKGAISFGLLAISGSFRFLGESDDQLFRVNLNARDPDMNMASVVNRLGWLEIRPARRASDFIHLALWVLTCSFQFPGICCSATLRVLYSCL